MGNENLRSRGVTNMHKWSMAIVLAVAFILVGGVDIFWLARYGNTPQVYTDIVIEQLGKEFGNKSIELTLYYMGTVLGLIIVSVGLYIIKRRCKPRAEETVQMSDSRLAMIGMIVLAVGSFVFYGTLNAAVILAVLVMALAAICRRGHVMEAVTCYFMALYSVTALYRFAVFCGAESEFLNMSLAAAIALGITCCLLFMSSNSLKKAVLLLQIPVPLLLLIYLVEDYRYQGQQISIRPEQTVYVLIVCCVALFVAMSICKAARQWRGKPSLANCISMGTCITIMAFQRFSGLGNVVTDMHHPAENTIAYNMISNLGRKAFTEYVPVSGLFSYVQGFFLELFGKGEYAAYNITNNVFYLVIIILIVFSIRQHLDPMLTFICSVFLIVPDYNRVVLIIPFMLILLSDRLIARPVLWLFIWALFSWCYGLYYPAYGAGIAISLFPLGVYQIRPAFQAFKKSRTAGKIVYFALFLMLFAGVAASLPLLSGTLSHVLAMGDGMLYVDGVTAFGQALPDNFLNSLNNGSWLYTLRLVIGYIVRFSTPMMTVWIAYCAVLNVFCHKEGRNWKNVWFQLDVRELCALSAFLLPVVCFYFSLYRMGAKNLFNRAVYIICYCLFVVAVVHYDHGRKNHGKYVLILTAVLVCTVGNSIGINGLSGKYYSAYTIGDDYVYTQDREDIPRLGEGFIAPAFAENIENAAAKYKTMDHERNYYMLFASGSHGMGYDAMLNIRGTAMLESLVVRGYTISADTAQKLVASDTIVGNQISPVDHYYLYRWLCTGGEYIWSEPDGLFYPVTNEDVQTIRAANSKAIASMPSVDVGRYAASLGNSIDSLQNVLTEQGQYGFSAVCEADQLRLEFDGPLDGNEVDYIYFDIDVDEDAYTPVLYGVDHAARNKVEDALMKHDYNAGTRVAVEWTDDTGTTDMQYAAVENGKLLMPVGAGNRWLNNTHGYVSMWLEKDGARIGLPAVDSIKLYKARDLEVAG